VLQTSLVSIELTTGDGDGLDDGGGLGLDRALAIGVAEALAAVAVELGLTVSEPAVDRVVPHATTATQTIAPKATPLAPISLLLTSGNAEGYGLTPS
jgi:hypothetical protein